MNSEKSLKKDSITEKEDPKQKVLKDTLNLETLKQKQAPTYLDFTDQEKTKVIKKITDFFTSQGHDVEGKQINFPTPNILRLID